MTIYDRDSFNPDISVGYLAKRVFQIAQQGLEPAFSGEDLSYLQWSALVSVWHGRGRRCQSLALDLGHDKGATTRLIDALEARGLLARARDPGDRRAINLVLTAQGQVVAERCMRRVVELWNGWPSDWSQEGAARLIGDLQRLRTTLEAAVGDTGSGDWAYGSIW